MTKEERSELQRRIDAIKPDYQRDPNPLKVMLHTLTMQCEELLKERKHFTSQSMNTLYEFSMVTRTMTEAAPPNYNDLKNQANEIVKNWPSHIK